MCTAIDVNTYIKKKASATIHKSENPYNDPDLDVMVILLGPKTKAAVINPGPEDCRGNKN